MFVSDVYEGQISDVEIVQQSGFLDSLEAGDLVISDVAFTIGGILAENGVHNVPPFLNGRRKLEPREEIYTKQTERVRIRIEKCIKRIKKCRLLSKVIPLSVQPMFSQIVFVAGCLVNFQAPLVA